MKTKLLLMMICLFAVSAVMAQETKKTETTTVPSSPTPSAVNIPAVQTASPADVSSIDGIMKAVYDVISGDAGATRNWERFRSLFHKDARMMAVSKNAKTGVFGGSAFTPEDYVKRVEPFFAKEGFYESELARRTETYGHITHVFSTYQSKHKKDDAKPFARGINSFQLMFDGTRYWVVTIYWEGETTDNPLPEKYLKTGN
jgi:hypothetical protein